MSPIPNITETGNNPNSQGVIHLSVLWSPVPWNFVYSLSPHCLIFHITGCPKSLAILCLTCATSSTPIDTKRSQKCGSSFLFCLLDDLRLNGLPKGRGKFFKGHQLKIPGLWPTRRPFKEKQLEIQEQSFLRRRSSIWCPLDALRTRGLWLQLRM